ncbi:MAG: hypothetical protein WCG87_09265 [Bacteroidota bacterium]
MKKKIFLGLLVAVIAAVAVVVFMLNKPHKKAEDQKGIALTAIELYKAYGANEKKADSSYLKKVLEVSGEVSEVKENQDHKTTVLLKSDDAMGGIFCTMRDSGVKLELGKKITVKGFCSGHTLTDVNITGCVLK